MVSISIINKLKECHDKKFDVLIQAMRNSGIPFFDTELIGPYGIATIYSVLLDIDKMINDFNEKMIHYIILHEMGHYKRIKKIGKDNIIKLLSIEDFDDFCSHVITEEIYADRYATFVYQRLTGNEFPRTATQQLELPLSKEKYKKVARSMFGIIQNDEDNYVKLLSNFIV